jgi:DNA-binding beta-propeller fold protein YncE
MDVRLPESRIISIFVQTGERFGNHNMPRRGVHRAFISAGPQWGGGWDYLIADSDARRLYVSHGTQVEVLDLDSDAVVGKVPDTPGVHGIALAPDLNRGFVSAGRANKVKIFDLKTLSVLGEVATGQNPDGIIYDPASKRVFAFNGRSNDATAIDAAA